MSSQAAAEIHPFATNDVKKEQIATSSKDQPLGVIEHLKEEFGDYSDPTAYDWTWRETD